MINNSFFSLIYILLCSVIFITGDMIYSFYNSSYAFIPNKRNIVYPLALFLALSLISKLWLRVTLIVLIMLSVMAHLFYFQYFGNFIQPIAFMQIFQSTGEVFESLLPEFKAMIVPLLIVILVAFVLIYLNRKFQDKMISFRFSSYIFFILVFIHLITIFALLNNSSGKLNNVQSRFIYVRPNRHSFENYMRSLNYFTAGIVPRIITGDYIDFPDIPQPSITIKDPDRNIVLIIGESFRGDRMSVLGYNIKTSPLLDSLYSSEPFEKRMIYAGGTMTQTAFTALINRSKYPGGKNYISSANNLFRLAKENGFSTSFISKQSSSQLEIIDDMLFRQYIDFFASKSDLEKYIGNMTQYDGDLIPMMKNIDLSKSSFVVLHQRGSHSPANNKYPEEFGIFSDPYNNSVLYTDYVIYNIYDYLKKNSLKETWLIFTSDHGELLGEAGNKKGHGWFEKEIYNVPYFCFRINPVDVDNSGSKDVRCHFDVSSQIQNLLGYDSKPETDSERTIYINGSEMNALAGYMQIKLKDGKMVSEEIIR